MGDGRWDHPKIQQVCAAVREQEAAIRRDLLTLDHTLDDGALSWDDLHAVIYSSPPNTAVFHAVEHGWGTTDYLLAGIVDLLAILAWQNTEDGQNNRGRPEPIPRPSDKPDTAPTTGLLMDGGVASVMTVGEFLQRRAEREDRWRARQQQKGGT